MNDQRLPPPPPYLLPLLEAVRDERTIDPEIDSVSGLYNALPEHVRDTIDDYCWGKLLAQLTPDERVRLEQEEAADDAAWDAVEAELAKKKGSP